MKNVIFHFMRWLILFTTIFFSQTSFAQGLTFESFWEKKNKLVITFSAQPNKHHYQFIEDEVAEIVSERGFKYFTFYRKKGKSTFFGHAHKKIIKSSVVVWCYKSQSAILKFFDLYYVIQEEEDWDYIE